MRVLVAEELGVLIREAYFMEAVDVELTYEGVEVAVVEEIR